MRARTKAHDLQLDGSDDLEPAALLYLHAQVLRSLAVALYRPCKPPSAVLFDGFADTPITCNAEIPGSAVRTYCTLDTRAMELLAQASARRQFCARALDRIARAARTIADLAGSDAIEIAHVAEAIQYRSLERLDTRAA